MHIELEILKAYLRERDDLVRETDRLKKALQRERNIKSGPPFFRPDGEAELDVPATMARLAEIERRMTEIIAMYPDLKGEIDLLEKKECDRGFLGFAKSRADGRRSEYTVTRDDVVREYDAFLVRRTSKEPLFSKEALSAHDAHARDYTPYRQAMWAPVYVSEGSTSANLKAIKRSIQSAVKLVEKYISSGCSSHPEIIYDLLKFVEIGEVFVKKTDPSKTTDPNRTRAVYQHIEFHITEALDAMPTLSSSESHGHELP